jgi:hypothetical protein
MLMEVPNSALTRFRICRNVYKHDFSVNAPASANVGALNAKLGDS